MQLHLRNPASRRLRPMAAPLQSPPRPHRTQGTSPSRALTQPIRGEHLERGPDGGRDLQLTFVSRLPIHSPGADTIGLALTLVRQAQPRCGTVRVVAIDGPSGSGAELGTACRCAHLFDASQRTLGNGGNGGGNQGNGRNNRTAAATARLAATAATATPQRQRQRRLTLGRRRWPSCGD